MQLPDLGTRVAIRSHRPPGSRWPFTDTVGELIAIGPVVQVRHKSGEILDVSATDIISVRALPPVPVLNRDIRSAQRAAAFAWPGIEHEWLDGWFLRASQGHTLRGNSAVPLEHAASAMSLPYLEQWYGARDLPAVLCLPDRLLRLPADVPTRGEAVMLVRDLDDASPVDEPTGSAVELAADPSAEWLALYGDTHSAATGTLTAVMDGELTFASVTDDGRTVGIARGAVTEGWVGISALRICQGHRRRGLAQRLCHTLLGWGSAHGARRAYVQVRADNDAAAALYQTMDFTEQHRYRYSLPLGGGK